MGLSVQLGTKGCQNVPPRRGGAVQRRDAVGSCDEECGVIGSQFKMCCPFSFSLSWLSRRVCWEVFCVLSAFIMKFPYSCLYECVCFIDKGRGVCESCKL